MNSKEYSRVKLIEFENALKVLLPKEQIEVTFNDALFMEDFRFVVMIGDFIPKHLCTGLLIQDLEEMKGIDTVEELVLYFTYEYLKSIGFPETDGKPPYWEDIRDCHRSKTELKHKRYLESKSIEERYKTFKNL